MITGDLVRVNIYNTGRIRWLNVYGPIKNSTISRSIFNILIEDPDIQLEVLDFYNPKKVIASYGINKQQEIKESIPVVEEESKIETIETKEVTPEPISDMAGIEIINETDEKDTKEEKEINSEEETTKIEEASKEEVIPVEDTTNSISEMTEEELDDEISKAAEGYNADDDFIVDYSEEKTNTDIVTYTRKKLEGKTKAEMKQILKDRGYTEGEYAPKYHDTLEILIRKILKTQ